MEQDKLREDFAHYLKGSGFSIAEVSKAIGISIRTIYNWRAAGQKLGKKTAQRLAHYIEKYKQKQSVMFLLFI